MDSLQIELREDGILVVEGIHISFEAVRCFAHKQDGRTLYAFRREGDVMHLTSMQDGDSAKAYLDEAHAVDAQAMPKFIPPQLGREALHAALYQLGCLIEQCGTSPELSRASTLNCDIMRAVGSQFNQACPHAAASVHAFLEENKTVRAASSETTTDES